MSAFWVGTLVGSALMLVLLIAARLAVVWETPRPRTFTPTAPKWPGGKPSTPPPPAKDD